MQVRRGRRAVAFETLAGAVAAPLRSGHRASGMLIPLAPQNALLPRTTYLQHLPAISLRLEAAGQAFAASN